MALAFSTRQVGDVSVVMCAGRMVGEDTAAFEAHLDSLIAVNPQILLHLGEVSFIDSAGLGMLVRYLTRTLNASGALRICAVSPAIDRVLAVSRLKAVLQPFDTEDTAIAAAHGARRENFSAPDVLCVDESEDVLAYVRELLRGDGHRDDKDERAQGSGRHGVPPFGGDLTPVWSTSPPNHLRQGYGGQEGGHYVRRSTAVAVWQKIAVWH